MDYKYHKRGKCLTCGDIIWMTDTVAGIICKNNCGSILNEEDVIVETNIDTITDAEHITAIQNELGTQETINLIVI